MDVDIRAAMTWMLNNDAGDDRRGTIAAFSRTPTYQQDAVQFLSHVMKRLCIHEIADNAFQ